MARVASAIQAAQCTVCCDMVVPLE